MLCHNPCPLPRGREGSLMAKSPNLSAKNVIRLNRTHSFLNFSSKIFQIYVLYLGQISSKLSKICSICPHTPRITQNLHQLLTHLYYIMFQVPTPAENSQEFQRITQIPCSLPTSATNHAKFVPFVNSLHIMFQAPAPAENSQEFQRITQIPHSSPTTSANYTKFAPFVNSLYTMFQIPDHWQRTH